MTSFPTSDGCLDALLAVWLLIACLPATPLLATPFFAIAAHDSFSGGTVAVG